MRFPKIIFIKVQHTFLNSPNSVPIKKTSWGNILSFVIGSLFAISESLPFIDVKYNGIIHALSKIQEEYRRLK